MLLARSALEPCRLPPFGITETIFFAYTVCRVYAVTHELTEFGELYDFLIVTDYPDEWNTLVYSEGNRHTAFAYVWNKDAVTHELTEFGELYDFLIVTDYPDEWNTLVYSEGNRHTAFAYVWNKDDDWCSEFSSITVQSFGGGIRRIA